MDCMPLVHDCPIPCLLSTLPQLTTLQLNATRTYNSFLALARQQP
jgi:hypothetical protein